ncbi:hypothetical protein COY27_03710 [Candidatus Woesearchaeota archaeon CG_4_10_14_0_2_um_filter_33_13]|nr:MAG: hypothetical protein COY27_03710 [Candidatus Woesearchaeota archaeon CG_4_10_14_0_2_um_filter_33_13]
MRINKKGAFFHWIIFGVVAAIGLYFVLSIDVNVTGQNTKGVWQLSYVRATQDAQKDLLEIDQTARNAIALAVNNIGKEQLAKDLGCGVVKGYPVWNNKKGFCELKLDETIKADINKLIINKTNVPYEEIIYSEGAIIGKTNERKVIGSSLGVIPTSTKTAGLFTTYESYLIKPFELRYEYNPGFRVKVGSSFGKAYETIKEQAKSLLINCSTELNLKDCLDKNKLNTWHYTYCEKDYFAQEGRVVPFCVKTDGQGDYKLALDFISEGTLAVTGISTEFDKDQNLTTISFELYPGIKDYTIYYTNWLIAQSQIPPAKKAAEIFYTMPSGEGFDYFQKSINFSLASFDNNCPVNKEPNNVYLCSNMVMYSFIDNSLNTGNYLFAVIAIQDAQETTITSFTSLNVN